MRPACSHCTGLDEESQLLHFEILRLSSEITSAEPRQISCSVSPRPCKSGVANEYMSSSRSKIKALSDIAFQVIAASRQTLKRRALEDLADAFDFLKELFSSEKEAVTHYEITSSNLVRALLLSLSSSHSLEWQSLVS